MTNTTLHSDPGAFGAALATLGFGEGRRGEDWAGIYWAFEHTGEAFRVICRTDDGDRVTLVGWDPARPAAKLEAWRSEFSGGTPQAVALAAIAVAVGRLDITQP